MARGGGGGGGEVGKYVLPIMPSIEGIGPEIDRKLGKAFGNVSKNASKAIADGAKSGAEAAKAELKKAEDAYTSMASKAADALGRVRTEQAKLDALREKGAAQDKIIAAEERVAKARRDSSLAARTAEGGLRSYKAAQQDLANAMGDAERGAGGLRTVVAGLGTTLATGVAVGAAAAVAGIAALAAGTITATKELYDLGAQFDETFDSLRIKTGATGPQLAALEQSVKSIAGSLPASIGDIGKVVGETSRALHLTGTDLDNVSKNIVNLGRLTGEDVDVKKLGQAFRGFGVDAKDQVPALNSLFRTYQKTGIGVNELLASVVKGGPQLREFGFDMGGSAALLTEFEEAGLDGDRALAALTKGLAQFAKDGKAPKQALSDTVGEIQKLITAGKDPAAQDLANKIFGAKAGLQIFEGVKSGALDLQQLQSALQDTGDTIQQAADDTDDFEQKWQEFKNTAAVAIQPLASGLFDFVNTELTGLTNWVTAHQPEIIDFFVKLADFAIQGAQGVTRAAGMTLTSFGEIAGGVGNVYGTILRADAALQRLTAMPGSGGDEQRKYADELDHSADAAFGWGEGLKHAGAELEKFSEHGLEDFRKQVKDYGDRAAEASKFTVALGDATAAIPDGKTITISDNSPETVERLRQLGITVQETPNGITVTATTDEAQRILDAFRDQQTGKPIEPPVRPKLDPAAGQAFVNEFKQYMAGNPIPVTPTYRPGDPGSVIMPGAPPMPRARGGIDGIGNDAHIGDAVYPNGLVRYREPSTGGEAYIPLKGGRRSVNIWQETGRRLGVMAFDTGGFSPDVLAAEQLVGTTYNQTSRTDCSGMAARVINRALNWPDGALMTTKNAEQWLAQRGFRRGTGGPGTISVGWYDHGPNPNDGHMAMTLSNGMNAEAGGKNGVFTVGAGAAGANNPEFDQHMYLPLQAMYGEGSGGGSGGGFGGFGGGGVPAGSTAGVNPQTGESGYFTPDAKQVREANERVADADARVKQAELRQRELKADAKESEKNSAQTDLDKAKREAADARIDLEEAKKGKFTASKSGSGSAGGSSGSMGLGGLGDIFGGFLKETFGLDGSLFPDISNLAPVKMLGSLLGAFKGPLQGAIDGQLGIQQPGWQPGMAVAGQPGASPSASGLPFGMVPSAVDAAGRATNGMAVPGANGGIGGAAQAGPIDMSRHVAVQVDSGPTAEQIGQNVRREIANVDRLHTYVPRGA